MKGVMDSKPLGVGNSGLMDKLQSLHRDKLSLQMDKQAPERNKLQRRPLVIIAAILTGLSIHFLNDSVVTALLDNEMKKIHSFLRRNLLITCNEKVTRTVRQFSPHLAAKKASYNPVIRGRPSSKRTIHICGRPRWTFVLVFSAGSCILWFTSCNLLTVLWAFVIGLLATMLHASFRAPNLMARLNTFREEFRAVWRNYSEL
ncbi:hypothetical protein GIB67_032635 [Kingdonia uniflora]|uniref:PRA1 family protein n=1 Tax=Kingdonia uniflora TaxID=39325 RepID=A0A7J7P9P9_9MAGN|nr:hypothetical protein GIB67_032635 [Kingdonia uniflora]